jgi:single-strand DNA-binding protein
MNIFTIIGRVGRDAEIKNGGKDNFARWSTAVDCGYGDKATTMWVDCTYWGTRAEKIAEYIRKGDRIFVQGEFSLREHEGKTYGQIRVEKVELLTSKPKDEQGNSRTNREPTRQSAPPPQTVDDSQIPF